MAFKTIAVYIFILVRTDISCYLECFGDLCNVGSTKQYCSSVYQMCVNCKDVTDDCFTNNMPPNCTSTCKDHFMEQQRALACPPIARFDHGHHNESSLSFPGDVVSFTCDQGYFLEGAKQLTCMDFGHWSQLSPKCIAIACLRPSTVLNGRWSTGEENSTFPFQHTIHLHCNNSFELVGSPNWTCTEKGWASSSNANGHSPFCKATQDCHVFITATIASVVLAIVMVAVIIKLALIICRLRKRIQLLQLNMKNETKPLLQMTEKTTKESSPVSLRRERDKKGYQPNLPSSRDFEKDGENYENFKNENFRTNVDKDISDIQYNGNRVEKEQEDNVTRTQSTNFKIVEEKRPNQNGPATGVNVNLTLTTQQLTIHSSGNANENNTCRYHAKARSNEDNDVVDEMTTKDTVPQQPDDGLRHPTMESHNQDETNPKSVPQETADEAGTQAGVVQPSGSNEQDLNPKVVVGDRFFHHGDNNGTTTSPNGYLPNKIMVPSSN